MTTEPTAQPWKSFLHERRQKNQLQLKVTFTPKKVMLMFRLIITFLLIVSIEALTGCTFTSPGSVSVGYGEFINISWSSSSFNTNVRISLQEENCNCHVTTVASNILNTGRYTWQIPSTLQGLCSYGFYIENVGKTNWCYDPARICILVPTSKPTSIPSSLPTTPTVRPTTLPSGVPLLYLLHAQRQDYHYQHQVLNQ
jgi:hypothetical protein